MAEGSAPGRAVRETITRGDVIEIVRGLRFPEGPVAMPDGSVIVVQLALGTVDRILPDGSQQLIAHVGGGPNGAAIGPDGALYICNSGGDSWHFEGDQTHYSYANDPAVYVGGSIQRIDLNSGDVTKLYEACDGRALRGPNDLVFDATGGFYFTDTGKVRDDIIDSGYLYYALADGSSITQIDAGLITPNGVGLSPDGTELYLSETIPGRLWAYKLIGPGQIDRSNVLPFYGPRRLVAAMPRLEWFDSLAVDGEGHICVGALATGAIVRISPDGQTIQTILMPEIYTTNICFGGPDMRTAYITQSISGLLLKMQWMAPGLKLQFQSTT